MRSSQIAVTFITIIAVIQLSQSAANGKPTTEKNVTTTKNILPTIAAQVTTPSTKQTTSNIPTTSNPPLPPSASSDSQDQTEASTIETPHPSSEDSSTANSTDDNPTDEATDSTDNATSIIPVEFTEPSNVTSTSTKPTTQTTPTTTTSTSTSTSTEGPKDCVGCQEYCQENPPILTILLIIMAFLIIVFIGLIIGFFQVKRKLNIVREQNHSNEMLQKTLVPKEQDAKELFDEKDDVLVKQSGQIAHTKKFDKNDPATRERHRKYIAQCKQQELEDGDLRKFAKSGTIFIPHAVTDAAFTKKCEAPDNVMIDKVIYDPSGNEVFDIGSDVDNIELNPSTVGTSEVDTSKLSTEAKSSASRSKIKTKPKDKSQKSKSG